MALVLSAQTVLLLLLAALTIFTTASALPAKKTCGKNAQEEMDELILSIMPFGNPTVKPPTSVDDLPKFCSVFGKALHRVEDTNKRCGKGNFKNLINVLVFTVKKHTKEICNKRSLQSKEMSLKKKTFLKLSSCTTSGNEQLVKCADISKSKILAVESAEKSKKLPLLCCELIQIKKCIFKTLTVQPGCDTEEAAGMVKDFVENFGAGSVASACGEFRTEARCLSEPGLVYPKLKESQRVPKTFIAPLLAVVSNI
ncbi:hypothetical protein TYRP_020840 [Tyrophagus putrescentiae]|nr:hypothetical protein TYRP_020840 [Tyrophagus putrescentiae]